MSELQFVLLGMYDRLTSVQGPRIPTILYLLVGALAFFPVASADNYDDP